MKFVIRETDDTETVERLDRVCFSADAREDFSGQMCWLAVDEHDEPVGFTAMNLEANPSPSITRMGVLPGYRGHRLQRRLGTVCVRAATALGYEAVYTYVSVYNVASLRSLIHSGFMPYSCADGWMQLGRWTKHKPVNERHAKHWPKL